MSSIIDDFRCSSSSIDAFFDPPPTPRIASVGKVRVGGLMDLAGFSRVGEDTLIHLSQQDFWKLGQDNDGYFIERLVDDSTGPVVEK
jgi:hypothetical protein